VLLQDRWDIRAYAYCGTGYTKVEEVFEVKARTKPTDYVYTETEIKRYEDLNQRIDEIEKNGVSPEAIDKAVTEYLEENPIGDVPTKVSELENDAGYATGGYVDAKVAGIVIPSLDGYATESFVTEAIKNTDHATKAYVDAAIADVEVDIDLSSYATRTELNQVANSVPTKVSQLSNDKGYLTKHQDISHLATIGQVQNVEDKIPTKTSQLTNDSGFLTQHQDLSHLAPLSHTHPSYALKTEIPSTEGLATETYVNDAIAALVSNEIAIADDGTLSITQVSTDKLVQGKDTLVLNGGSASVQA
jgi:hypothetical protein